MTDLNNHIALYCDIGNTRLKWRLSGHDVSENVYVHGNDVTATLARWLKDLASFDLKHLQEVRVSCVAHDHWLQGLRQFSSALGVKANIAKTTPKAMGVINGYQYPETLGVDRWLAILAAFNMSASACCIIDAGSALTIDQVNNQGVHSGGIIVPGLRLSVNALLNNTGKLAVDGSFCHFQPNVLGKTTEQGISNGCLAMLISLVNNHLERFKKEHCNDAKIYLTGGDADILKPYLNGHIDSQSALVLDGLQLLDEHSLYELS